jgi:hypothetical protein
MMITCEIRVNRKVFNRAVEIEALDDSPEILQPYKVEARVADGDVAQTKGDGQKGMPTIATI